MFHGEHPAVVRLDPTRDVPRGTSPRGSRSSEPGSAHHRRAPAGDPFGWTVERAQPSNGAVPAGHEPVIAQPETGQAVRRPALRAIVGRLRHHDVPPGSNEPRSTLRRERRGTEAASGHHLVPRHGDPERALPPPLGPARPRCARPTPGRRSPPRGTEPAAPASRAGRPEHPPTSPPESDPGRRPHFPGRGTSPAATPPRERPPPARCGARPPPAPGTPAPGTARAPRPGTPPPPQPATTWPPTAATGPSLPIATRRRSDAGPWSQHIAPRPSARSRDDLQGRDATPSPRPVALERTPQRASGRPRSASTQAADRLQLCPDDERRPAPRALRRATRWRPGGGRPRRRGSSPSDRVRTPSMALAVSCTTLRSAGFIGSSAFWLPGGQHVGGHLLGEALEGLAAPLAVAGDVDADAPFLDAAAPALHRGAGELLDQAAASGPSGR